MRTHTLTFIDVLNHGTFFQAYALQRFLTSSGIENLVIDYAKGRRRETIRGLISLSLTGRTLNVAPTVSKLLALRRAYGSINRSVRMTSLDMGVAADCDVLILGSDEVWRYDPSAVESTQDVTFFGEGATCPTLAYAVSVGNTDITKPVPARVAEAVRNVDGITVRDHATQDLVHRVLGVRPPLVLDPVFLHDFAEIAPATCAEPRKYVLLYAVRPGARLVRLARQLAEQLKIPVISSGYSTRGVVAARSENPSHVLNLFRGASVVLTNTFHGCVLAAKFNHHLGALPHTSKSQKIASLLHDLNLQHCLLDDVQGRVEIETLATGADHGTRLAARIEFSRAQLLSGLERVARIL
jgi:hypothetical protein